MMLTKPSRLDRDVASWARRVAKAKKRDVDTRAAKAAWAKRSVECAKRDGHVCRVCGCQTVKFGKGDPRLWGMAHHRIYRSAGGSDELSNLLWVCQSCHDKEHKHEIQI